MASPTLELVYFPITPDQLRSPAVMLETLKLAYLHALDTSDHMCGGVPSRLSSGQECELGRRLAAYRLLDEEVL